MKKFFKILKIVFTIIFFGYILIVVYFLCFSPIEKRFASASHAQGFYISQTMFNIITLQNPAYAEAYFEQSVPFNKRGDFAKGFKILNKAVELDPIGHLGYRGYMNLRFLRAYKNALHDFDRLDSLTPNFIDAPWGEDIDFLRGESYYGVEDYQNAITCFNRNIKNNKEEWVDINTFVYLGSCEFELGNYEKAIFEFNRTLKQSEYSPEAHFGLARTYLKLGSLKKASEHILKAEEQLDYKRNDPYKEFLNEIYISDISKLKQDLTRNNESAKD